MSVYVGLIFGIVLLGFLPSFLHNSKYAKIIFLFISFMLISIVIGLRGPYVGEDTIHYLSMFDLAKNIEWSSIFTGNELRTNYSTDLYGYTDSIENGFLVLMKVIHLFTDNGTIFLLIIASITSLLFAKFIYDNCEQVFLPTYIFLCESMFMFAFNGIRQLLAIGITLQAYTFLRRNKYLQAFLIIIIAMLFHNTAIIMLFLFVFLFTKSKINSQSKFFKFILLFSFIFPLLIILFQNFIVKIFPRYSAYFSVNYWESSIGKSSILLLFEIILIFIMYKSDFKHPGSFEISILTLVFIVFEIIGLRITIFTRLAYYFRAYLILFFPLAEKYFNKTPRLLVRIIILSLLLLFYFSYANTPWREYYFYWQVK